MVWVLIWTCWALLLCRPEVDGGLRTGQQWTTMAILTRHDEEKTGLAEEQEGKGVATAVVSSFIMFLRIE